MLLHEMTCSMKHAVNLSAIVGVGLSDRVPMCHYIWRLIVSSKGKFCCDNWIGTDQGRWECPACLPARQVHFKGNILQCHPGTSQSCVCGHGYFPYFCFLEAALGVVCTCTYINITKPFCSSCFRYLGAGDRCFLPVGQHTGLFAAVFLFFFSTR